MIRRVGFVAALVVCGMAAGVSSSTAAVTLGRIGAPTNTCTTNFVNAQTFTAPGHPAYAVPPGYGVITSWSSQAPVGGAMMKLTVWRPTGAPNEYIYLDTSPTQGFASGAVSEFPVRIPVQPNDVLGLNSSASCVIADTASTGDLISSDSVASEPAKGSRHTFVGTLNDFDLVVSARVETDADNDGFGDETQDQCPTNASTQGPCPVTGQRARALKKCKKTAKKKDWTKKKLKKCKRKAKLLPV